MKETYTEVAKWIVHNSDKPIEEVEWLLRKIYDNTNKDECEPNINDDYGKALEFERNR